MPDVKESEERKPKLREWTVMFCFATDNPLAPSTVSQLKAIKNAGFHHDVNVIAQFDPHTVNMPVHIFDVNMVERLKLEAKLKGGDLKAGELNGRDLRERGLRERELKETSENPEEASNIGFAGNDPFVRNLVLDKLWDAEIAEEIKQNTAGYIDYNPPVPSFTMSSEQNPKNSLARFLNFCRENYPARHYMLIILAHGIVVGNDIFMFDEHGSDAEAQQHALTLSDLGSVLDAFKEDITDIKPSGELELIGFHSCSMSGAEVAFELKGKANYMMASQGPMFVGSWPYRQILIRLFNDMENGRRLGDDSIAAGLSNRLKTGMDAPATHLREMFNGNGAELLQKHRVQDLPSRDVVEALKEKIGPLMAESALCDIGAFQNGDVLFSEKTMGLVAKHRVSPLKNDELRTLNLAVLDDAFPDEMSRAKIREMFIKMFEYTIYNSFDFQLAGYSSDLTLCDLNRVDRLQDPMTKLAETLVAGLKKGKQAADSSIRDAILLSHWEAQSYFDENFTDIYDFCFRLTANLTTARPQQTTKELNDILDACEAVMNVLQRGARGNDFGPIVRCVFCGPAYQYSHGLSIFFPWAEPIGSNMWDKQYEYYKVNKQTHWKDFLETYFDETMRKTQQDERDDREPPVQSLQNMDQKLLGLLERMSAGVLSGIEQLKIGARDPLGFGSKIGGGDPTGASSDSVVIKNYPHFTGLQVSGMPAKANFRGRKSEILTPASGSLMKGLTNQMFPDTDTDS